ncbi:hypothetical protein DNTS_030546 [Danionella cerebrum]|uniref:Cationic amino acid transporter C-terminal domain-containing protein n=1 Tax=Danionella cerebrum TaxID=2873325 RepID=A0A553MT01_9TELE|nr:hypothetical protein DNTS_030546 [Danionella translucida]
MFPMPRVLFAMARDGLLFKPLSKMSSRQSPVIATLCSGLVAAIMAMVFDLKALVDMMSVGTLFAYTLVAICILILRYQEEPVEISEKFDQKNKWNLFRAPKYATSKTSKVVSILTILCMILSLIITQGVQADLIAEWWMILIIIVVGVCFILTIIIVWRQPQNQSKASFMVRLLIYFCYGVHFSVQRKRSKMQHQNNVGTTQAKLEDVQKNGSLTPKIETKF